MLSPYLLNLRGIKNGVIERPAKKLQAPIAKMSAKKIAELKAAKPAREDQNEWFEAIANKECKNGFATCWNCGEKIPAGFIRAATAHVLPKRKDYGFPSVRTHAFNYLILGAGCGCHNLYDRSWEDAAQMPVFNIAVERFTLIYPSIAQEEKKHLPEVFLQEILI